MNKDANTVSCTCTPSRGLACRKCYAPHYKSGLHLAGNGDIPLINPTTVAAQLVEWSERNKDEGDSHG